MSAATPEQAAARAFVTGCVARGLTASQASVPPEGQLSTVRGLWADVAQAVVDAATEGSLRACGYTLADVGRFLEAEAAAREPHAAEVDAAFAGGMRVRTGPCTVEAHDREHFQVRTNGHWLCGHLLASVLAAQGIVASQEPHAAPGLMEAARLAQDALHDIAARCASGEAASLRDIGQRALAGLGLLDVRAPQPAPELDGGYEPFVASSGEHDVQEIMVKPAPELAAERDGLRKALRAISLGIALPSPKTVADNALNGRYFDPETDSGVWRVSDLGTAWRLLDEARERMAAIAGERDRLRQALVLLADDGNLEAAGSLNQIEPAGLPS